MTALDTEPEVLFEQRGLLGLITLNRPKAINALTHGMVTSISAMLTDWAHEDRIATVAIVGAGERGLCAGGDIVSLHRDATEGDGSAAADFWFDEYHLNAQIHRYPKPIVAIQDGIVLGGGIGISAHASHRVVTERSRLGLPEVGIGFVPDVGATWLLSRAPGQTGTYLALTGGTVTAADAIFVGLADHLVAADRVPRLLGALEKTEASEAILLMAGAREPAALRDAQEWIDDAFSADSIREICARLLTMSQPGAAQAATAIETKSPTALAVTLASLRRARAFESLEQTLDQEFRVSRRALAAPDFAEGVRAQVIDKDRSPRWAAHNPQDDPGIDTYFLPLADRELGLADSLVR